MSELFDEFIHDVKGLYNDTMAEIKDELDEIEALPDAECDECDDPEYMESAVATSHYKIIASAIKGAMKLVGDSIFKAEKEDE